MSEINIKEVKRLSLLIEQRASSLEARKNDMVRLVAGKLEVSVTLGTQRFVVNQEYGVGNYHTVRGREMFNLAARKLLAGQVHDLEAELHALQGQLGRAMRGEA